MFGLGDDVVVNGHRIRMIQIGKNHAWYGVDSNGNPVMSGERRSAHRRAVYWLSERQN